MRSTLALAAATAVLAVTAAGQAAYIASRPNPARVLSFPEQRVLSRVGDRPGVRLGGDLSVRGTKCNVSGHPVQVSGTTSWVAIDPPGSVFETGRGSATRVRGCVTRTFANQVPVAVVDRTRALTAAGARPCVTWRITGREVPVDPAGLPAVWQTEPFDLCP